MSTTSHRPAVVAATGFGDREGARTMPLADSNGPDWIRRHKAVRDGRLAGAGPIRRFLAGLFGRRRPDSLGSNGPDEGAAGAGSGAPLLPRVPVLSGAAARRLEDEMSATLD